MLSEILFSLLVILMSLALAIPLDFSSSNYLEVEKYQSEVLVLQSEAMLNYETLKLDNISFNEFGHINLARTIDLKEKQLVMFLGMGRSEIRKGNPAD